MKATIPRFWHRVIILAIVLHLIFCIQALFALSDGGMVANSFFLVFFYAQCLLMFFLPPRYPIIYSPSTSDFHVDYIAFCGKMIVAFPASFFYSLYFLGLIRVVSIVFWTSPPPKIRDA